METFITYCSNGDIDRIKNMQSLPQDYRALLTSCANGHVEVVKYLCEHYPEEIIHAHNDVAFRRSCENGHFEVMKYLCSILNKSQICTNNNEAFQNSCVGGYTEIVKYLCSNILNKSDICDDNNAALVWSCVNNHIEIVKYLCRVLSYDDIFANNYEVYRICHNNDNVELMKYFYETYDLRDKNLFIEEYPIA